MSISDENERFTIIISKENKFKLAKLAEMKKLSMSNFAAQIIDDQIKQYEKDMVVKYGKNNFDVMFQHTFGDEVEPHRSVQMIIEYDIDPDATEDDDDIFNSPMFNMLKENPLFNEKMSEYFLEYAREYFKKNKNALPKTEYPINRMRKITVKPDGLFGHMVAEDSAEYNTKNKDE